MTRKGRKSQSRRGISISTSLTILPLKRPSTGGLRPPYWMYPLGPPIAARYNRGNTKQHRHAPMPTYAATERILSSVTTPRRPLTQAAKKLGIEPLVFPVPPTESPVDGAGPQRGRKDGPPDSYLGPLNPHGSPFFFGFQKPFFFQQGKRNGFCRPRKVRTVQNALAGISHSAPLLVLSPRDPLRWARAGTP